MKVYLAILASAAAAALAIAPAGAQDAKPTPCNGLLILDAKGDQVIAPLIGGNNTPLPIDSPGPDNTDLRGVFFNLAPGADGKPVLTANLQITDLTSVLPSEAVVGNVRYFVDFATLGDVTRVFATLTEDGWTFSYDATTTIPMVGTVSGIETKETKGKVFEGKDGIIQIEIPASSGVKDGTEMKDVKAFVRFEALGYNIDEAPQDAGVVSAFKIRDCPSPSSADGTDGGSTTPPDGSGGSGSNGSDGSNGSNGSNGSSGAPAGSGPGTATAGPQPTPGQPGAGLLPVAGPLTVAAAVDKGKRKTARKRGLRARVRCSVQCKVTAVASIDKRTARKLKLGKKAVKLGTGKATIIKPGRIPFFVKMSKKVKKALGRKGVKKFKLKVVIKVTDLTGKQLKTFTKKSTLR